MKKNTLTVTKAFISKRILFVIREEATENQHNKLRKDSNFSLVEIKKTIIK